MNSIIVVYNIESAIIWIAAPSVMSADIRFEILVKIHRGPILLRFVGKQIKLEFNSLANWKPMK